MKIFTKIFFILSLITFRINLGYSQTVTATNIYNEIAPLTGTVISDGSYSAANSWITGTINTPTVAAATNYSKSIYCILNSSSTSGNYYIGYDFGAATTVGTVAIYPINETLWTLQGVKVQGANTSDFSDAQDLITFDSTQFVVGRYNYFALPPSSSYQYVRILAPASVHNNADGKDYTGLYLNEFAFYGSNITASANKIPYTNNTNANPGFLTGQIISVLSNTFYYAMQRTTGASTKDNYPTYAFDDLVSSSSYLNGNRNNNPGFVFDFGESTTVDTIGIYPNGTSSSNYNRIQSIIFELSDDSTFATINGSYTIPTTYTVTASQYNYIPIPTDSSLHNATGRYIRVRKTSSAAADLDIQELRFYKDNSALTPVTTSNLSGELKDLNKVILTWKTYTEINSGSFIIERSTDKETFKPIGTIKAAGNSTKEISYSFTDNSPLQGVNYYRFHEVDLDGKSMYSNVAPVTVKNTSKVTVYPNPIKAKGYLKINTPDNSVVKIINLSGHEIVSKNSNGTLTISTSNWSSGFYFINVYDLSGKIISTSKVIVQ
ncbi:MAG: T9SS type A sorting domain-containing protein [Arachidicoccus sp.]|nr:T9SS type A sorting domain-containing protein [Arachidicoccus sp.]